MAGVTVPLTVEAKRFLQTALISALIDRLRVKDKRKQDERHPGGLAEAWISMGYRKATESGRFT